MGKYDNLLPKNHSKELLEYDWATTTDAPPLKREIITMDDVKVSQTIESSYDRKLRMLRQVSLACSACSMCELGRVDAIRNDTVRDPHVFSNMNPTRFVVVGQNPGWNELCERTPFVGDAGNKFNITIEKYGLTRQDFYITNVVKCFTKDNAKPTPKHVSKCKPFLLMELNLIHPKLVITLGASSFELLCQNIKYGDALGRITHSAEYDVDVFAVYHPSPRNLSMPDRAALFDKHMRLMCAIVKRLKAD